MLRVERLHDIMQFSFVAFGCQCMIMRYDGAVFRANVHIAASLHLPVPYMWNQ